MAARDKMVLLSALGLTAQHGRDVAITGLAVDSRDVKPGFLFAALPGVKVHGAEFIQYALRMKAAAILTDQSGAKIAADVMAGSDAALVVTQDPRAALSFAAALWFGRQPETMVAVTGTNGKTSVATFTRQIWAEMGYPSVNIGTTGVEGDFSAPSPHTTPEPITLHRLLAEMASAGVTHAAMEASSHGLDQRRLEGVHLAAAAFTNFTQDHLDYHESFAAYFAAKARLFTRVLPEDGIAVLNVDDPRGRELEEIANGRGIEVLSVGRTEDCTIQLTSQRYSATGQDIRFLFNGRPYTSHMNLIGGFQAENVLIAAGLVIAAGGDPDEVFQTFPHLTTVRGRMQLAARRDTGATVFVDYAHTPAAISTALEALRPHVMGKIVVVFGAGGDRDTTKRKLMGQAAADYADIVIVTDDNPRSEDPATIRAMVMEGCRGATEVGDRAEAILRGVDMLDPGDALLIAGKGHESGQIVGDDVLPFDDAEQASVAVAALEGRLA